MLFFKGIIRKHLIYDFKRNLLPVNIKDYILVYAFDVNKEDRIELKKFAEKNNLKIISIVFNERYSWVDKNLFSIDPLEFVALFEHAKYVYTSTFHGLLFAIKFKKQVALRNNSTIQSKCSWIIEYLKLHNILISQKRNVSKIFNDNNLFDEMFDKYLKSLKRESISFLKNNIREQN